MRTNRTIQLSIPTPCSQNWDEMSINDNGRFCNSCNKSVIDFTNYSDQQLAEFFKRSTGEVCGKLRKDQLEKTLYPLHYPQNRSFPHFLISAALAIGLGKNVHANEKHIDPIPMHESASREKKEKQNSSIGSDGTKYLSGTIIDQHIKETLPGVTVLLEGTTIATTTDMNGFFKLDIPDHLQTDTIKVIFSTIGYEVQTLKFSAEAIPVNITIELKVDKRHTELTNLKPVYAGGIRYKSTFRQRIKCLFGIKN